MRDIKVTPALDAQREPCATVAAEPRRCVAGGEAGAQRALQRPAEDGARSLQVEKGSTAAVFGLS